MSDPTRDALRQALDTAVAQAHTSFDGGLAQRLDGQPVVLPAEVWTALVLAARAALSTTPARLDVGQLARAIHETHRDDDPTDRSFCPACFDDAQRYAREYTNAMTEPTLDAAWAAAEAALPEGWHIASMASDGPENPGWYVDARSAMFGGQRIAATGHSLAAALLALAEKLREYQP